MAWSIAEVARMSNTTSRTLRHYDDIGLLKPAFVGENGYRYYERDQLLRLQQILLLRQLGLGLPVVSSILSGQQDTRTALTIHREHLQREQERLRRLQRTVERTIEQLDGGQDMSVEEYFDGFERNQAKDEQELVRRFGERVKPHIEESRQRTKGWKEPDYTAAMAEWEAALREVRDLIKAGHTPGDQVVQDCIAGHHAWLAQFWTADRESYTGLGHMYAEESRFRAQFDAIDSGLAEVFRDAMAIYAERNLP
ncbi:MAG TPA: MerR family transcriptional regulator [Thermomicrobiales bacterium]|nr:MerR family transcriptional regulator [Thermomicrobiales bacterium]